MALVRDRQVMWGETGRETSGKGRINEKTGGKTKKGRCHDNTSLFVYLWVGIRSLPLVQVAGARFELKTSRLWEISETACRGHCFLVETARCIVVPTVRVFGSGIFVDSNLLRSPKTGARSCTSSVCHTFAVFWVGFLPIRLARPIGKRPLRQCWKRFSPLCVPRNRSSNG